MTRVLPVGCRDCQFLEWPVCHAPFLCWGMLKENAEEKEAPGFQQPGAGSVCNSNSNEVE